MRDAAPAVPATPAVAALNHPPYRPLFELQEPLFGLSPHEAADFGLLAPETLTEGYLSASDENGYQHHSRGYEMAPNTRSGTGGLPEGNPPHGHVEPEEVQTPGSVEDDPMEDAQDAQNGHEAQDAESALSIHDLIEDAAFEMETGAETGTLAENGPPTAGPQTPVAPTPEVNARITALNARYQQLKPEKELAELERNVAELEAERLEGFAPKGPRVDTDYLNKDALALERATEIRAPKIYLGKSQQELDT